MAFTAKEIVTNFLRDYGLEGLGDWAWSSYIQSGAGDLQSFIQGQLSVELPKQPLFQARFPAYEALRQQGQGMTVDQIRNFESKAEELATRYLGDATMFKDPQYISKILVGGVRENELEQRFALNRDAATQAPPEVRQALQQMYGVQNVDGALTAYYFDPERALPILTQQYQTAQIAGAALTQHVEVSQATAERLQAQGVTWDQAQQGFRQVALGKGLEAAGGDAATAEQMTAAAFGDATAQAVVDRARKSRQAAFSGGGSAAEGQAGVSGLGSTTR